MRGRCECAPATALTQSIAYDVSSSLNVVRLPHSVNGGASGHSPAWLESLVWHGHHLLFSADEASPARVYVHEMSENGVDQLFGQGFATGGDGAVSLAALPQEHGGQLFVANYDSGSVSALDVDVAGRVTNQAKTIAFHREGTGPVADRQSRSFAHQVMLSPDGRFLYVADLGADRVHALSVGKRASDLQLVHSMDVRAGSGPRHLAFFESSGTTTAYLAMELSLEVQAFVQDSSSGKLTALGPPVRAHPDEAASSATRTLGEIAVSPDGRFVYASHRGDPAGDHIASFSRGYDGSIDRIGWFSSGGRTPRHFSISADGKLLAVANQDSDNVRIQRRDAADGSLRDGATVSGIGPANFAGFAP